MEAHVRARGGGGCWRAPAGASAAAGRGAAQTCPFVRDKVPSWRGRRARARVPGLAWMSKIAGRVRRTEGALVRRTFAARLAARLARPLLGPAKRASQETRTPHVLVSAPPDHAHTTPTTAALNNLMMS